jgi:hypothetical protein
MGLVFFLACLEKESLSTSLQGQGLTPTTKPFVPPHDLDQSRDSHNQSGYFKKAEESKNRRVQHSHTDMKRREFSDWSHCFTGALYIKAVVFRDKRHRLSGEG